MSLTESLLNDVLWANIELTLFEMTPTIFYFSFYFFPIFEWEGMVKNFHKKTRRALKKP